MEVELFQGGFVLITQLVVQFMIRTQPEGVKNCSPNSPDSTEELKESEDPGTKLPHSGTPSIWVCAGDQRRCEVKTELKTLFELLVEAAEKDRKGEKTGYFILILGCQQMITRRCDTL